MLIQVFSTSKSNSTSKSWFSAEVLESFEIFLILETQHRTRSEKNHISDFGIFWRLLLYRASVLCAEPRKIFLVIWIRRHVNRGPRSVGRHTYGRAQAQRPYWVIGLSVFGSVEYLLGDFRVPDSLFLDRVLGKWIRIFKKSIKISM